MADNNNDFLSMISKIVNDKIAEFTEMNPDTPIFANNKKEMAEGAVDIISQFISSPSGGNKKNDSDNIKSASRDILPIIEKVNNELPKKPCIKLTSSEGHDIDIFESKAGGLPYFPKGMEYPAGISGTYENRPLKFLAQLNFDRLPKLAGFPQKGMLQFFCSDDTDECVYGADFDDQYSQNGFRVIYHENIITDREMLCTAEDIPSCNAEGCFPVIGEFLLTPSEISQSIADINDCRFEQKLLEYCSMECGEKINMIYSLKQYGYDIDRLYKDTGNTLNSQIGGYPMFTQSDPRNPECKGCDTLLFQLDSFFERGSKAEIMWGDMGIANFFISADDLAKCDFSRVMFNWDCG